MKIKIDMPSEVEMIIDKLSSEGHEAVIIGGCVRDSIMGIIPHDWDIATSAQPTEIMDIFKNYRLMTAGLKHGTVTVIIGHEPYEITTYRVDGKYSDFRRPDSVSFTSSLAEDILRRDFTINAIAFDGKKIIDLHNGIEDLKSGIIRCVGNPDNRFQEDPLRILRAIRFAARFNFKIEKNTSDAMRENKHLLEKISIERKQSEFSKAICANNSSVGCLGVLKEYQDILSYVMPQISDIEDWDRTIDTLNDCHDLCEKLAILIDKAKIIDYNKVVTVFMRYPNKVAKSVSNIIDGKKELITFSEGCIKNLLSKYPKDDVIKIIHYKIAKINNCNNDEFKSAAKTVLYDIEDMIERIAADPDNYCFDLKHLEINGNDLKALGIPETEIKHYLRKLLELVMFGLITNKRDELIQAVEISTF